MLSLEENEQLCRVGPAADMGKMFRRYWIPAVVSADLTPGGAPRRMRLLGEDFVAFRDTDGRAGILEEHCPHRGASLVLARNEDCGLPCLYHGWKIDVEGRVLETPAEPDEHGFRDRVRATAYPTHEAGGFVWAYFGPADRLPATPDFAFTTAPESHRFVLTARIEANYLQRIEGLVDSAHSNNWLQNREAMERGESFSGITGVNNEDFAVEESMGAIYDRRREHLGASDVAVIRLRLPWQTVGAFAGEPTGAVPAL